MFASLHRVETQPLVAEERWDWLLGRLQSLWSCLARFDVFESSKDGMWVSKESCSSFPALKCFWKGRRFKTGVSFSRGHVSEFARYSRASERKRPSLGLCLESRLGQNRCVEGVEVGCMGGSLCWGGVLMNRSGDSCLYQWLCSGLKCGCGRQKCADWYPGKLVQFLQGGMKIGDKDNVLCKFKGLFVVCGKDCL